MPSSLVDGGIVAVTPLLPAPHVIAYVAKAQLFEDHERLRRSDSRLTVDDDSPVGGHTRLLVKPAEFVVAPEARNSVSVLGQIVVDVDIHRPGNVPISCSRGLESQVFRRRSNVKNDRLGIINGVPNVLYGRQHSGIGGIDVVLPGHGRLADVLPIETIVTPLCNAAVE